LGWEWWTTGSGVHALFRHDRLGEALAHELALAAIDESGRINSGADDSLWDKLPFRKLIPDPFGLRTYPLMLSISTLTIRRSRAGTTFLLLRRGTGQVAIAGGMLSVMPTGVFQPASILPTYDSSDFDMWHNMMREYSEEFLGNQGFVKVGVTVRERLTGVSDSADRVPGPGCRREGYFP